MQTVLSQEFITAQAREEALAPVTFKQTKLTQKYLLPHLPGLKDDLLRIRLQFDARFDPAAASRPNPYPKGYCYEITKGVKDLLEGEINRPTTPAMVALREFCAKGGIAKRVWGNLRGEYFQNAFQLGSLYADTANDTVTITKPKVEILPLARANFTDIDTYHVYAALARRYWNCQIIPNRYLADIAVLFPIFVIFPDGRLSLHASYKTILYRNMMMDFTLAEDFLRGPNAGQWQSEMPESQLERLVRDFGAAPAPVDDNVLADCFARARDSQLQYDAPRCQSMLDKTHAIGRD